MRIAVVVGSLREKSHNKTLAQAIVDRLPSEHDIVWMSPELPLMNEDDEADVPQIVRDAASVVAQCDAVLIVSPEYNRSFSGLLKNWLDWMSRESVGYPLDRKLGAIAGASTGQIGTAVMQSQLRPVLAHIGMDIMPQPDVFIAVPQRMAADGSLPDETDRALRKFTQAFSAFIAR